MSGSSTDWRRERHVKIFDTTLRDGQQCPGAGMSFEQNLEYANLACTLRVDILEAGFPAASNLDFQIVRSIAEAVSSQDCKPVIAALCQLREEQFERTIESLKPLIPYGKGRLHTYVPVDPELMPASLGKKAYHKQSIIEDLYRLVKMAVREGLEVQFSPEGYSRMRENFHFTTDLIRAAVQAGATIINCPDTIGGASIFEGKEYFVEKMNEHAGIIAREFPAEPITWSVHCHNDFGLAVQNTANAVFHGPARQIEGCINGIGERAGNAAIEQCIMVIKCFAEQMNAGNPLHTTVDAEQLQTISDFVSKHMLPRQPHWPVSGDNAAKHSSGGHTNAILKNPLAYQPFDPKETGKKISFLFGPLSGGNHAKAIIESSGFTCSDSEKSSVAQFIKDRYPQRRKGITDAELIESYIDYRSPIRVDRIDYSKTASVSTVKLHGKLFEQSGVIEERHEGRDSALAAVKKLVERHTGPLKILNHRSQSEGAGFDARSISEVVIVDRLNNKFEGTGMDQDIEISAIRAFLNAVNKSYVTEHFALKVRSVQSEAAAHSPSKPLFVA